MSAELKEFAKQKTVSKNLCAYYQKLEKKTVLTKKELKLIIRFCDISNKLENAIQKRLNYVIERDQEGQSSSGNDYGQQTQITSLLQNISERLEKLENNKK